MEAVMERPAKAVKKVVKKETPQYGLDSYKTWYETMYRIRRFEERVLENYGTEVRGFCHVYIGQEAIAAGMKTAMKPEDGLVTAYRTKFCNYRVHTEGSLF